MTEVLSQDEIDQLLTVVSARDCDETSKIGSRKNISIYDFKRPEIFTRKEITRISNLFEKFVNSINRDLWGMQRDTRVKAYLCSTDLLTYEEFTRSIPHKPNLHIAKHRILKNLMLEIDPSLEGFSYINVFKHLTKLIGRLKRPVDFSEDFLLRGTPLQMYLTLCIELQMGDKESMFNVAIPARELRIWLYKNAKKEKRRLFNAKAVKTAITASLGKTELSLGEVEELDAGSIIELDRKVGDSVPIFVDGQQIGVGEVVIVDDTFGVRIVERFKDKR